MIRVSRLDHVALPVADMDRSLAWYQRMFGLVHTYKKEWGTDPAFLCVGGTCIALLDAKGVAPSVVPVTQRHVCFLADQEVFLGAMDFLGKEGIPFQVDDHQVSRSLYFQDPDGHWIEITCYRPGLEPGSPAVS